MTIELPVLRLGLAGFTAARQSEIQAALARAAPGAMTWELARLQAADAWWVDGRAVRVLSASALAVPSAGAAEPELRLHLPDVGRPLAFALPLSTHRLDPAYTFDPDSISSMAAVLEKFEAWLSPLAAQFCLASHIVEQEAAIGRGVFEVSLNGRLLAVVDMQGDVGVLTGAGPVDFEDAEWRRRPAATIPSHLVRCSMSQLMWQYALRTRRDLLPPHYRSGLLYFRRPPRLAQRMLGDSQLLLMRELAHSPARFQELQHRTRLGPAQLARDLAALYFVGAITSNPKRAAAGSVRPHGPEDVGSSLPSGLDFTPTPAGTPPQLDMTAPVQLGPC